MKCCNKKKVLIILSTILAGFGILKLYKTSLKVQLKNERLKLENNENKFLEAGITLETRNLIEQNILESEQKIIELNKKLFKLERIKI